MGDADVAGYPATQISSEIQGDGGRFESLAFTSSESQPFGTFTGVVQRWYVTDVAGRTVIVWIEAPVDQFNEWVIEAEAALTTLEFLSEKPGEITAESEPACRGFMSRLRLHDDLRGWHHGILCDQT